MQINKHKKKDVGQKVKVNLMNNIEIKLFTTLKWRI